MIVKAEAAPGLMLSENDRLDFHARADRVRAIVQFSKLALARKLTPVTERQRIEVTYCFPATDRIGRSGVNRRRDAANWAPTTKAIVDGLVRAGILRDDSDKWVLGPDNRLGPPARRPNTVEIWLSMEPAPARQEQPAKRTPRDTRQPICGEYVAEQLGESTVRYYCTAEPHDASTRHRAVTANGELRW